MATGYVYDPIFLRHTYPNHPESAQRLETIIEQLKTAGLWQTLEQTPARPATFDELARAHQPGYIRRIEAACRQGNGYLNPDTYVTSASYRAATVAAGSLIDLTLAVAAGRLQNGFALVRPPGHHATQTQPMGFCLFGNVALAALAALNAGLERVAIIDFDVHHGNGTQA
ncbi:MAG: histone deacetylase, partial [Anaerolineae bacterium]